MNISSVAANKTRVLVALAVVLFGGIGIWAMLVDGYRAPPKTNDAVEKLVRASTVVIPVAISLDDIQHNLNAKTSRELYKIDEGRDACVPAQWIDICAIPKPFGGCIQRLKTKVSPEIDCHVSGTASRGDISVSGERNVLRVTMPVSAKVTVRGRGEIGKHIQETADGAVTASAAVKADIGSDWKPSAAVTADYSWNNKIGVDVLGFRITFASKVDPKIREAIDSFSQRIPEHLATLNLKNRMEAIWAKGFTTIPIANSPDVWLTFSPSKVGFSGYDVTGRTLKLSVMASGEAETTVGAKPVDPVIRPLPPLTKSMPNSGFEFFVPVAASYATIKAVAKKSLKIGETQQFDIPNVGNAKVTFKDVDIYQTTDKELAIGLTISADLPNRVLDTNGTAWFTASVSVDNASKKVRLDTLKVHSQTDNKPIDMLLAISQFAPVNKAIREAIEYDFTQHYGDLIKQANTALRRQIAPEFYIEGSVDNAAIERVVAGPDSLVAAVSAKGKIELRSGKLPR